jgi:hypothetical protein
LETAENLQKERGLLWEWKQKPVSGLIKTNVLNADVASIPVPVWCLNMAKTDIRG